MERRIQSGLIQQEWMQSVREVTEITRSGGEISINTYQVAIDLRQTANEGDYVSPNELARSLGYIDAVSKMPERLKSHVLDGSKIIEHDFAGNTSVKNAEVILQPNQELKIAAD